MSVWLEIQAYVPSFLPSTTPRSYPKPTTPELSRNSTGLSRYRSSSPSLPAFSGATSVSITNMEFDLIGEEISYLKETKYRNFFKEILSAMSPSDITDIVVGKSELVTKLESFRDSQFPIRDDLGRLWNAMISHDAAESLKSLVKKLKLELRLRNKSPDKRDEVDLQALKSSVSIAEVIGSCADMRNYRPGRNMKCPFP